MRFSNASAGGSIPLAWIFPRANGNTNAIAYTFQQSIGSSASFNQFADMTCCSMRTCLTYNEYKA